MKNSLFSKNEIKSLIKKHEEELDINSEKIKIINKWLTDLKDNKLKDETSNYARFQNQILEHLLNYTINDFTSNYTTESNESVEFVLLKENKPYAAIELKGSDTDLDKYRNHKKETVSQQCARYATSDKSFEWCIISNYNEFRLFHKTSRKEYISFKFEELTNKDVFKIFLFCFSKFSLITNELPLKIYDNKFTQQTNLHDFENEFYKLFSETRSILIKELQTTDEKIEKIGLNKDDSIHYAQLILNRYIFLCFAEDKNLLPSDITIKTLTNALEDGLYETELWDRLTKLFRYVDEGFPTKNINKFNGGLFRERLKKLHIRDYVPKDYFNECYNKYNFTEHENTINELLNKYIEIYKDKYDNGFSINPLFRNLLLISSFDFDSEVDVNILGHIFENSIGDIEKLKGQISSKRKKDGVFYTPPFITEYICHNTIIPYLSKTGKANTVDDLISEYNLGKTELMDLDNKLKNIKIVDPACGSGAFLNKACDILLEIHEKLWELLYKDDKSLDKYFDNNNVRKKILIDNLYGVDLNSESVEITKLGMFLKVSNQNTQLPNLDKNIKCGNSLIKDTYVIGGKAFNWENEFPEIFKNGGFDIVIGNPPYVRADYQNKEFQNQRKYLINCKEYETLYERWDLFIAFIEKGLKLLKNEGNLSFIISNSYNTSKSAIKSKEFIMNNYYLKQLDFFKNIEVFKGVGVESLILNVINTQSDTPTKRLLHDKSFNNMIELEPTNDIDKLFRSERILDLTHHFNNTILLGDICYISYGLRPNADEKKWKGEFKKADLINDIKTDIHIKPYIEGKNLKRYQINHIRYLEWDTERCPAKITRPTFPELYIHPKIIKGRSTGAIYDTNKLICNDSCIVIVPYTYLKEIDNRSINNSISKWTDKDRIELEKTSKKFCLEYLLGFLNSNLSYYYLNNIRKHRIKNYFYPDDLKKLPIKNISLKEQEKIKKHTTNIIQLNKDFIKENQSFINWLIRTFKIEKLSKKLESYYELTFEEFLNELKKKKIDTKSRNTQELLLKEYTDSINKIKPLQLEIQKTDDKINQLVYELYDLTPEEINIIEESLQKQ